MKKVTDTQDKSATGDLVLQEVWNAKDTLSASYGHNLDKLFAETRKREKRSRHRVVNLENSKPSEEVPPGEPIEQDMAKISAPVRAYRREKKSRG